MMIVLPVGCAGRANIQATSLNVRQLSDRGPLIQKIPAGQCYYFKDQGGRFCVAAKGGAGWPGGASSMVMSLSLGKEPAGKGRHYLVNNSTFRMITHRGGDHQRWASTMGIVGIWRRPDGAISGRFRIFAKRQSFHVCTGWQGNHRDLLTGDFIAVPDTGPGFEILRQSEAQGMARVATSEN